MKTWSDWETIHQPYELRYHMEEGIEWCSDSDRFWDFWTPIFDFIGAYRGGPEFLDVGCGPRPPFGHSSTAIEPLADQYRELAPEWWDGVEVYAQPAERFITDLAGRFHFVVCWNCLDHTIGWQQILANLKNYGTEGAVYAIATDFNPPAPGHPSFSRAEFFTELAKHFEIVKYAEDFQERDMALVLRCA